MTIMVQQQMMAIEQLHDRFHAAVFAGGDLSDLVESLSEDCRLEHVPWQTGATGPAAIQRHVLDVVRPALPAELRFRRQSRTGDRFRVVDQNLVSFRHDRELPWLLPGVAGTDRPVEVLAIAVTTIHRRQLTGHRILWDGLSLSRQLGLLDPPPPA